MNIPGMTASHQIIREACRTNRGASGAFEEAVQRMRDTYHELVRKGIDPTTEIHLALIVQQERHRQVGKCGPLPGSSIAMEQPQ